MSQNDVLEVLFVLFDEDAQKYHSVSDVYALLETDVSLRATRKAVKKLFQSEILEMDFKSLICCLLTGKRAIPKYRIIKSKLKYVVSCLNSLSDDRGSRVSAILEKEKYNIRLRFGDGSRKGSRRGVLNELS